MKPFPHHYKISQSWKGGRLGALRAAQAPELVGGPPPEFDGSGKEWSPEHLLLASLDLCLMTTYMALAERKGLKIESYSSETRGTLDKTSEGLVFTEITQAVKVKAADSEKAEALLHTAKKYCLIGNALKAEVKLAAEVAA